MSGKSGFVWKYRTISPAGWAKQAGGTEPLVQQVRRSGLVARLISTVSLNQVVMPEFSSVTIMVGT